MPGKSRRRDKRFQKVKTGPVPLKTAVMPPVTAPAREIAVTGKPVFPQVNVAPVPKTTGVGAYPYFNRELLTIALMSGIMLVVVVVAALILR